MSNKMHPSQRKLTRRKVGERVWIKQKSRNMDCGYVWCSGVYVGRKIVGTTGPSMPSHRDHTGVISFDPTAVILRVQNTEPERK